MSIAPNLRFPGHEVWITVLLFVCLLMFVWVRVINPRKIPSLVSGVFRSGITEEKTITPDSIALFFIFTCTSILLIMQAFTLRHIKTHFTRAEQFFLLGIALLAYYLIKTVVLFLCGVIFQVRKSARDYINEIFASAHLAAVFFLPAAIVLNFVSNINQIFFENGILVIIGLFLLYRTIKMLILMMNRGLSVIYLFLYLCTLEIIPWVLLFEYGKGINF